MNEKLLNLFRSFAIIGLILISASLGSAQKKDDVTKALAREYLRVHQYQLEEAKKPNEQFALLIYLTPAAFIADEKEKAKNYAQQLFEVGKQLKDMPGFGPGINGKATHIGNIVLGLIAFDDGNVEKAKEHLLAAGQVVGNPTLKSFGPNMLLAKLLVEKGERETAVKYLDLCANFWESDRGRLDQWKNTIKQGGMPDFRASLTSEIGAWQFAK